MSDTTDNPLGEEDLAFYKELVEKSQKDTPYGKATPMLYSALKEATEWIESLRQQLAESEAENERLTECEQVASNFNAELVVENERLRDELDFMYKIMTSLDDIHEATKIIKEKYGIKEPK